jgi:hypothetical protein
MHGKTCFFSEQSVESAQERAAAASTSPRSTRSRKVQAGSVQGHAHRVDNGGNGSSSASRTSCEVMVSVFGKPATRSRPLTSIVVSFSIGYADPILDLDILGRALTDHQIVSPLHVLDDRLIQFIAGNSDASAENDARREIRATSVVPPPISIIMLPAAS